MRPASHYGQFQVAEPHHHLSMLYMHDGVTPLTTVDHEPSCPVLDQQDLGSQGIDVTQLLKGAAPTDALGSCTSNANVEHSSERLPDADWLKLVALTDAQKADAVAIEKAVIVRYSQCTMLTGDPAQEYPTVDCGSSGVYLFQLMQNLGLVSSQQIAADAQALVALLQGGSVLSGGPFLQVWEEPGPDHVVDGDGSAATLQSQIAAGVAGGHETCISAVEKIALAASGLVIPEQTLLRVRNSWSRSWGDDGSFYIHLSSLVALWRFYDFRQWVPVTAQAA